MKRENNKMKKILLTTIASTLIATAFGGVANGKALSGNTTIWAWNINIPPLKSAAKEFMQAHPNTHIKISLVGGGDILEKLSIGLIAHGKGLPDALLMQDQHFNSFVGLYPRSFVNVGKMGMDKLANLFPVYKSNAFKYKSHMYGFPFDGGPVLVFYRRDVFAKAGVKPSQIKTWNDFLKYGKIIKAKTGKFMFGGNDDDSVYRIMMEQYGKRYYDKNGNIDLKSPRSIKVLKFLQKMNKAGILHHRAAGWNSFLRELTRGTVAAVPAGAWLEGNIETVAPKSKGKWGVMPLPVNGDGDVGSAAYGGSAFVMLQKSKNKALTYAFLKYFTTELHPQLVAFKEGLFPTLNKVYKTKEFNAGVPFFKGQKVWTEAAKAVKIIRPIDFTNDFHYAELEMGKLQSGVIFADGGNLMKRLDQAAQALHSRTGRKINEYK